MRMVALVFAAMAATLLSLAASAAPAIDWEHAKTLTVVTRDYRFVPKRLMLKRGVPYRIVLVNRGRETHEFHSPQLFAASEIRNPDVLNPDHTEVVLQPGDRKELFLAPNAAGKFPLICPDHDWAGMTGRIDVR